MEKIYSKKAVNDLLGYYKEEDKDIDIYEFNGCLGEGYLIIPSKNTLRCCMIRDTIVSNGDTGYKIRFFTKLSKKISDIIDIYNSGDFEKAGTLFHRI